MGRSLVATATCSQVCSVSSALMESASGSHTRAQLHMWGLLGLHTGLHVLPRYWMRLYAVLPCVDSL